MFQSAFIKRNCDKLKKHVFKIVHVPHHRFSVKTSVRIAEIKIQAINPFYLKINQLVKNFPVNIFSFVIKTWSGMFLLKKGKQVHITKILKEIDKFFRQTSEYFRYRKTF